MVSLKFHYDSVSPAAHCGTSFPFHGEVFPSLFCRLDKDVFISLSLQRGRTIKASYSGFTCYHIVEGEM